MSKETKDFCYIGIDPGLSGAVAVISSKEQRVYNTPTIEVKTGKKRKNVYDVMGMVNIFKTIIDTSWVKATDITINVALEKIHAMPGQGVTSMFSMGEGFGIWKGIVSAFYLPMHLIPPQTWKKAIVGTGKDKEASRLKAIELFPKMHDELKFKKDHDKAEALLIAEYLHRVL